MKFIFFIAGLVLSVHSFTQCTECTSLKDALKKPETVKSLIINGGMSGQALDSIPGTIGLFTNLEFLYLTDHNIKTISPEIANLKKLKELSFGGNKLTEVPEFIFELKSLKELILLDNPFSDEYKTKLKERVKKDLPKTSLMLD